MSTQINLLNMSTHISLFYKKTNEKIIKIHFQKIQC
jgi:hypothetical protein